MLIEQGVTENQSHIQIRTKHLFTNYYGFIHWWINECDFTFCMAYSIFHIQKLHLCSLLTQFMTEIETFWCWILLQKMCCTVWKNSKQAHSQYWLWSRNFSTYGWSKCEYKYFGNRTVREHPSCPATQP